MRDNYDRCLKLILREEGGWANHPKDPGGATMFGVTQRVYDAWRSRHGLPQQTVRKITADEVRAIYRTQYAEKIRFDDLPVGVDLVVFDGAVHSGPAQSVKWLQRALGVTADGVIGNVTLKALRDQPDHDLVIEAVAQRRERFFRNLKRFDTFGRGWMNRLERITDAGQQMAAGTVGEVHTIPVDAHDPAIGSKAEARDAAVPSGQIGGPTAGAGAGTLAIILEQVRQQLAPYAGVSIVDNLLLYLTLAAVAVAVAGFGWGLYARFRRGQLADALDLEVTA